MPDRDTDDDTVRHPSRQPANEEPLLDQASRFIDAFGGDGEQFKQEVGKRIPAGASADGTLAAASAAAEALLAARNQQSNARVPPIDTREIVPEGHTDPVGLKIIVDDPDATIALGEGTVVVAGAGYATEVPHTFDPNSVALEDVDAPPSTTAKRLVPATAQDKPPATNATDAPDTDAVDAPDAGDDPVDADRDTQEAILDQLSDDLGLNDDTRDQLRADLLGEDSDDHND